MLRLIILFIAALTLVIPTSAQEWRRSAGALDAPAMAAEAVRLANQCETAKAKGDMPAAFQANSQEQGILNELISRDPQNPKWKFMRAQTWKFQAGGNTRSGTAGDRVCLKMAIQDLDAAASCPGGNEYASRINALRAEWGAGLAKRQAAGIEIQRRAARQFAKIYSTPGNNGGSTCYNCGHWKSNVDRCPWCGH